MKEQWRLLELGGIDPLETQMVYEAVAIARAKGLVLDTIIFCWPKEPLVCIGFHQEVEKEIDFEYCKKTNIPIVRRILGGGAVYLDAGQLFYQIIASEDNPKVPKTIDKLFEKMLEAPIQTYREIGIPVKYKPINDIEVNGKKISGNGAGKVEKINILTGNLIIDFNFDEMVKILRVPSEKFRDKLASTLKERLTTITYQLGTVPAKDHLISLLKKSFENVLEIKLQEEQLSHEEESILKELRIKYLSEDWIFQTSLRHPELLVKLQRASEPERVVKIAGGIYVCESIFKSEGGLIRVTMEVENKKIKDILISGDFEFIPKEKLAELEKDLLGLEIDETQINNAIVDFYKINEIQAPGTLPQDFTKSILLAIQNL
ncbi:MAG TPA: lipoate--protein ligase [Candidatus Deferrimicrobium sp.]|nr:lipoate--protein ligase [Candidatus Deferrimicrobium sp.]